MQRQTFSNQVFSLVGPIFVLFVAIKSVGTFQTEWNFGRLCMPQTLTPDGIHYLSGRPIDPVTLAIVRSGWQAELHLAFFVVMLLLFYFLLRVYMQIERNRKLLTNALTLERLYRERREENAAKRSRGEYVPVPLTADRRRRDM